MKVVRRVRRWRVPSGIMAGAAFLSIVLAAVPPARPQIPRPEGWPQSTHAEVDGLAMTPPMGWYPWNVFGEGPQNEKLIKEIVDASSRAA